MGILRKIFRKQHMQIAEEYKQSKKYILPIVDSKGRTIETDLCCFCVNQEDLMGIEKCKYYDSYDYDQCPYFKAAPNQTQRIDELFAARCN